MRLIECWRGWGLGRFCRWTCRVREKEWEEESFLIVVPTECECRFEPVANWYKLSSYGLLATSINKGEKGGEEGEKEVGKPHWTLAVEFTVELGVSLWYRVRGVYIEVPSETFWITVADAPQIISYKNTEQWLESMFPGQGFGFQSVIR